MDPTVESESSQAPVPFAKRIRPFLIAFIVIPISVLLTLRDYLVNRLLKQENDPTQHDLRVGRIIKTIRELDATGAISNLRTDRDAAASHSLRIPAKTSMNTIKLRDLNCILDLDLNRMLVRVEPGVTVGDVTTFLLKHNLQLEATLEMEDATLGGLALSQGMTTHSHVCGLVADTCESFEFVGGNGELYKTKKGDMLHRAMMFSHGTLGVLVALELRVVHAERFVRIKYKHVRAVDLTKAFETAIANNCFFIDAIIFAPDKAVVIEGNLTADTDKTTKLPVNRQGRWWKEWFFKRVEHSRDGEEELMPMRDYLMRHDRSMCMTMETVFPIGNAWWFRYLFGWTLPPKISFLKASHTKETRRQSMQEQVYQDIAFPMERFADIFNLVDRALGIYPLLCYSCKMTNYRSMIRFKPYSVNEETKLFMNLGIYGVPHELKQVGRFPTLHRVRTLEAVIRSVGGFQHTYCDTLQTREEFEMMFDHSLLKKARAQVGSEKFPMVYDKVRPEIDIEVLLAQEANAFQL